MIKDITEFQVKEIKDYNGLFAPTRPEGINRDPFLARGKQNDNIKREYTYRGSKLQDMFRQWYKNGQLYIECFYIDGELCGQYRRYKEDGTLEFDRIYYNSNIVIDDTSILTSEDKEQLIKEFPTVKLF